MEKTQGDSGDENADGSKKKPTEKAKGPIGERKRAEVLMPRQGEHDLFKALQSQKAITIYTAARSLNVSASIARAILANMETKGMVHKVGGFSGHYVWAPSLTSRT